MKESAEHTKKLAAIQDIIPNIQPFEQTQYERHSYEGNPQEFTDHLLREIEKNKEVATLFSLFKGQILIDLGPGCEDHGYQLAQLVEAKSYIGVEPNNAELLSANLSDSLEELPAAIAPIDALTFLRSLPDHSVSIFCSGIDECIIKDQKYIQEVAQEIQRVLHEEGAYIEYESEFGYKLPEVQTLNLSWHPLVTKDEFDIGEKSPLAKLKIFSSPNCIVAIRKQCQDNLNKLMPNSKDKV